MARYTRTEMQAEPARRHGPVPEERRPLARLEVQARDAARPARRPRQRRLSDYALQLREKQKIRRIYGILERQFRNYYKRAAQRKGATGENLLQAAGVPARQRRLPHGLRRDPRRGAAARQPQGDHGERPGGEHPVLPGRAGRRRRRAREGAQKQQRIQDALQLAEQYGFPDWVDVDVEEMRAPSSAIPEREELPPDINEHLVVELYSK